MARVDIVSIGTLSRNLLWNERTEVRSSHATTTLVRAGKLNILVDPGLPGQIVAARLFERSGLKPEQIDVVFLTNLRPAHRGGMDAFPKAKVLAFESELEHVRALLARLDEESEGDSAVRKETALLERVATAPDKLAPGVDLFPMPGFTTGTCGLLVTSPTSAVLVAGDGVPTIDHFLSMQALPGGESVEQALESMKEVYEIADIVVPGHDNVFVNPRIGQ